MRQSMTHNSTSDRPRMREEAESVHTSSWGDGTIRKLFIPDLDLQDMRALIGCRFGTIRD
jgi:hypothetical protein